MKKMFTLICAGVLVSALATAFVACNNEPDEPGQNEESGLGEVIPGIETQQATGTVIGSYSNGFGSLLVQVDEKYPIGKPIEVASSYSPNDPNLYTYQPYPCATLKNDTQSTLIYQNMIQVQWKLPIEAGNKLSFSFRKFLKEKDDELFTVRLTQNEFCMPPDTPIYVITDYKIINDEPYKN
jgi:hypothetical protein